MKKKKIDLFLIICTVLTAVVIILTIAWFCGDFKNFISVYPLYKKDSYLYGLAYKEYLFNIIIELIILAFCIVILTLLVILDIKTITKLSEYVEVYKARRAEKKRAKTEAKKERLKAELEELENDEKRTLD